MAIDQFGFFSGKDEAIKTLKQTMEDFCKSPDRRNPHLTLHFNNLWRLGKKYADLFHDAMINFFRPSSEGHAIVDHAVSQHDDSVKIKATEVALLTEVLVRNHSVINYAHYSDDVMCRSKLVANIVEGLIKLKFGSDPEIQQKLLPLAELYQGQYNALRAADIEKTVAAAPTASPAA